MFSACNGVMFSACNGVMFSACNGVVFSACNGVVLATEKKHKMVLFDENSIHKVDMVTKNIGMTYSGIGPDYR